VTRFQKLTVATTAATVALITIGGLVRASGSGLGCPDWPRCHGRWIPPLESSAIIEYTHRLAAAVVGAMVLALAIYAWARMRTVRSIFWPSFAALGVVIFQGGLGKIVVERELQSELVAFHFGISLALLGLLVAVTVNSFAPRGGRWGKTAVASAAAAAAVAAVLMIGALVTQWEAALVFPDWPLMDGRLVPRGGRPEYVHYLHRVGAVLVGAMIVYLLLAARRLKDPALVKLSVVALAVWVAQVMLGAANVLTGSAPWAVVLHLLLGSLLWVFAVALAVLAYRRSGANWEPQPEVARGEFARVVGAYFRLTKPRIIELLLIATVPSMVVAAGGWPAPGLVAATLIGGALAAAAANAINCYFDRDIDALMPRTSGRPLPSGEVEPSKALLFGILLGALGFGWMVLTVNFLAASLSFGTILFYVFIYTLWLKRSTPSNIVIGGAAGAVPPLVGWAAVTGQIGVEALLLFAIIFYWTPPHFWALALRYEPEYRAAKVPMLPVVLGTAETTRQILLYSIALVSMSALFHPVGRMGILYLVAAPALGAAFIGFALRLWRHPNPANAMSLFRFSTVYLTSLFATMAADRLVDSYRWEAANEGVFAAAAVIFLAASAAILSAVARNWNRRQAFEGGTVVRSAELAWTAIPALAVASLLLLSWQGLA
jgi:protoheme IX farnesyltransferase